MKRKKKVMISWKFKNALERVRKMSDNEFTMLLEMLETRPAREFADAVCDANFHDIVADDANDDDERKEAEQKREFYTGAADAWYTVLSTDDKFRYTVDTAYPALVFSDLIRGVIG